MAKKMKFNDLRYEWRETEGYFHDKVEFPLVRQFFKSLEAFRSKVGAIFASAFK